MIGRKIQDVITSARIVTGVVLMVYCLTHFLNHAAGIISLEAMDVVRVYVSGFWRLPVIKLFVPGSLIIHILVSLFIFFHSRSLKKKDAGAIIQLIIGLLAPIMLFGHIIFNRQAYNATGNGVHMSTYVSFAYEEGSFDPFLIIMLSLMVWLIWLHGCIGIHRWLKVKEFYNKTLYLWFVLALLPPVMSLFGLVSGVNEYSIRLTTDPIWIEQLEKNDPFYGMDGKVQDEFEEKTEHLVDRLTMGFFCLIVLGFIVRFAWLQIQKRKAVLLVRYDTGTKVKVAPGTLLLEASRFAGVPHASACGGAGRCSTCRTRVLVGHENLPPPENKELKVLKRIAAAPNVRLACQVPLQKDVCIHPLLKQAQGVDSHARPSYSDGEELEVSVMFADLRGFTKMTDGRLPFDIVYILNQYFEVMGESIEANDGYIDKFIGDGIMAVFGIRSGPAIGARQAIGSAIKMGQRLDELNHRLENQLSSPLEIGIAIHKGSAIIGQMGYGETKSVTAIGSTVNTAARLEGLCSDLEKQLVVSSEVVDSAGVDFPDVTTEKVDIRGLSDPVEIYAVEVAGTLKPVRRAKQTAA